MLKGSSTRPRGAFATIEEAKNGQVVAQRAINFRLYDHCGTPYNLHEHLTKKHIIICFYPGGRIKPICTKQFCSYRDNFDLFQPFDVEIVGISTDKQSTLAEFARENQYPFYFLTDNGGKVATIYGCSSFFMLGMHSRAVFIVHKSGMILYRYVEPTILTSKGSTELLAILHQLASNKLLSLRTQD